MVANFKFLYIYTYLQKRKICSSRQSFIKLGPIETPLGELLKTQILGSPPPRLPPRDSDSVGLGRSPRIVMSFWPAPSDTVLPVHGPHFECHCLLLCVSVCTQTGPEIESQALLKKVQRTIIERTQNFLDSNSVMVNSTCQLDWATGWPGIWSHITLDVSVRVFLDEANI